MEPEYVHVSLGQFESTAISKLVARGVREDVARAFVTVGLRKQDGYSRYKEIVCKAKFHSFFVHRPNEGTMVPTVLDRKTNKFRAPYAMTGREKAEIISSFPELDVICDGTIRNPHAFYANKRLAECEMLISWVWATAIRYSDLDPKSIVDLGGNHTQHTNRGRNYVHCDTPVLSAKDIYRYTVREVYAGVDPGAMCSKSFRCCDVRADFGIAVHATYDLTPQAIADGMQKRGMKFFFGVINLHPMLASLSSGEYIHDGMVLKVNSDSISYSFAHDTSLSYTHSKYGISQYLKSKLPLEVSTSVGSRWYSFEHKSVRGSTIVFSISEVDGPCEEGTSMATGLRSDKYRIDLAGLAEPMEVDRELFDRAVLMAASSRKIEEYNITSLYKYVKSLRQRISINSIVLSSGFKDGTDVLVRVTVAALAVASAYHTESMRLFSAGSKEIMMRRDRSVFSDIFSISGKLVDMCVTSLSDLVGYSEAVDGLKKWAVDLLKQGNSVQVSVATVKDFGNRFRPSVLGSGALQLGNPSTLEWFSYKPAAIRDASFSYKTMSYLCVKGSGHPNHGMFSYSCFAGYGYANVYPEDLEITEVISSTYKVGGLSSMVMECKYDKDAVYKAYLNQFSVEGDTDGRIRTLSNGDSVLHVVAPDPLDASVGVQHCFVAFRGVGSKFVICEPPGFYTSRCLRFVLFFEEDISGLCADSSSLEVENLPNPLYSVVKHCASNLQSLGQTSGVVYSSEGGEGRVVTSGPTQPRFFGAGSIPPTIVNDRVEASDRMQQLHDVFENATEYMSDDDADDDVLNEAVGAMSNVSVGSGSSGPEPVTPVLGKVGAKTEPLPSVGGLSGGVPSSSGFRTDAGGSSVAELSSVSESTEVPRVPSEERDGTVTTDQFGELLRRDQGLPKRSWAGSDTFSSVSEGAKFPGADAMSELLAWAEETGNTALSVGRRYCGLAKAALAGDLPEKHWNAVRSGLEGNVQICHVVDGGLVEYFSGRPLSHMAVTDGDHVLVTKSLPDGAGPFVTYSDLEVWTVASIVEAVSRNLFNDYSCPVELVIGPAGCGKTTEICKAITSDDMGLCETREAAKDTAQRLEKTGKTLAWKFSTVDSFLINRASTFSRQGVNPTVLYLDEALRLHAGKIWCLIKVLRPQKVVCFGDPEQIPLLPFTPNFEFKRSVFPWSSTTTLDRTYRLPGDITMMLVCAGYYPYKFKTYSGVARGFKGVKQFYQGIFSDKPAECVVLTYTQSASEDLRRDGVFPVMTIGESQGKDLDHVWLFRESDLSKDIYYSVSQTLTAITRVKKTFTFVTVCFNDDSEINTLLRVLDDPHSVGSVGDYMH